MAVGEINYSERFSGNESVFAVDALILIVIFILVIPILFLNLMLGIAVDDIEKIRQEAALMLLKEEVSSLDLVTERRSLFQQ